MSPQLGLSGWLQRGQVQAPVSSSGVLAWHGPRAETGASSTRWPDVSPVPGDMAAWVSLPGAPCLPPPLEVLCAPQALPIKGPIMGKPIWT